MKKPFQMLAAAALLAAASTVAQAQVSLIPRIGLNFSSFGGTGAKYSNLSASDGTVSATLKTVTGFSIGAGLEIPVSDYFAIQPELMFNQFGGLTEVNIGGAKASQEINTNNLQIPVLLKGRFGSEDFKFNVFAGPYVTYALSGTIESIGAEDGVEISAKNDLNFRKASDEDETADDFRRVDFGAQFGIGFGIRLGPGMAGIDARYNLGLSNLTQTDPLNIDGTDRDESKDYVYNRSIMIGLSYAIPLGGQ